MTDAEVRNADLRCTCTFVPPSHAAAIARSSSGYRIYLDLIDDASQIDPACPYHGDNGTMVARIFTQRHE